MKWDVTEREVPVQGYDGMAGVVQVASSMGDEGWQLVHFHRRQDQTGRLFFTRPAEEKPATEPPPWVSEDEALQETWNKALRGAEGVVVSTLRLLPAMDPDRLDRDDIDREKAISVVKKAFSTLLKG